MNASVSGLAANATRLSTISDNIANSSTFGYKRAVTDFYQMVIDSGPSRYTAGGVRTSTFRLVDQRGSIQTSTNATDLAINGRGFLPVTDIANVRAGDADLPFRMTTTGSFRPDAEGYLRNAAGHVLLGVPADALGNIPPFPRDTSAGLEPVRLALNQLTATPTTEMEIAVNLPATGTIAGAPGTVETLTLQYFDNLGKAETLSITFTPTVPGVGASNTWTMEITDSASGGAVVGSYEMVFDDTRGAGGRLASATDLVGGPYDPVTGILQITVAGGPIDVNIGAVGSAEGMTQLSNTFSPIRSNQNGAASGILNGVEVDENGYLHAIYDSGFTRRLYQIPLVDVSNPNGLTAGDNQTFMPNQASGGFYLWDAGAGPTGKVVGYAREESSVDIASELTALIQTQRAYSSNAKVIQTVDEMLQETTNIKR